MSEPEAVKKLTPEQEQALAKKKSEQQALIIKKLESYIPDTYSKDQMGFLELVNKQVLGVDKQGNNRPFRDLQYFLSVSKKTGLDPLGRQLYAVYRNNWKTQQDELTIQVSIDGFRLIAQRSGDYAGQDDAVFALEEEYNPITKAKDQVFKASVTVYKLVNGVRCGVTATARWDEYAQTTKDYKTGKMEVSFMWAKLPKTMLAKCAEALALRKAFPQELSGMYTVEEMAQADNPKQILNELPKPSKDKATVIDESINNDALEGKVAEEEIAKDEAPKTETKPKKIIKNVKDAEDAAQSLIDDAKKGNKNA